MRCEIMTPSGEGRQERTQTSHLVQLNRQVPLASARREHLRDLADREMDDEQAARPRGGKLQGLRQGFAIWMEDEHR
jgi:hypothetical protein